MQQKFIEKNDINLEKIHNILDSVFIENTLNNEENRIVINVDDRKLLFTLKENQQLATLSLIFMQEYQDEDQFLKIISALNEINSEKIFIKTSALQANNLIIINFEIDFRYNFGFNIPQFIDDLRFFIKLTENYLPVLLTALND